jgi:hypothetical protein
VGKHSTMLLPPNEKQKANTTQTQESDPRKASYLPPSGIVLPLMEPLRPQVRVTPERNANHTCHC